ncbi:hypothetical protein FRC08_016125 [Ceratobasidium sp. 394]|nr:hypothetical protein FRC08_016125 [Ceratobasidium sp. 394]
MRANRTDHIHDSGKSAVSIQAQLSCSPPTALLNSSSATYRTLYVARPDSPDCSPSSVGARHSPYAARQHTYPFTHHSRSPPALVACAKRGLLRCWACTRRVICPAHLLSLAHHHCSFARLVSARMHSVALFAQGTTRQG